MVTRRGVRQAREVLDQRLGSLGPASLYTPPRRGWIRAVRDALGMSAADLAARMGIADSSVRSMEENEIGGGIRLSSLRRTADAMDCTLVYAFVPNESLEATVRDRASEVLRQQMRRVDQTMALEEQQSELPPSSIEERLEAVMDSGRLWSSQGTAE